MVWNVTYDSFGTNTSDVAIIEKIYFKKHTHTHTKIQRRRKKKCTIEI